MTAAKSDGRLEAKLRAGMFVLTAEMTPPDAASAEAVLARAGDLRGLVDACNVTDGAGAKAHMAPMAAAAILARHGIEPILQVTVRDRNRLAIQADYLGAPALGIPNILCLHGDSIDKGDQPDAKPVVDLDSRGLLSTARIMRDTGAFPSGRTIDPAPRLFIGAADSPKDPEHHFEPKSILGKIEAGADFFQTQFVYDLGLVKRYMARLDDLGILEKTYFIVGVGPLASANSARWMNANLFGVNVPQAVIARLEVAEDQAREGRRICAEIIEGLQEIRGIGGAHIMAPQGVNAILALFAEHRLRR
jgi:methylenetetrahydrofolate reductase (NADPH)